ncbi:hypothetical protein [Actinoplanes philippinensis]|uniref:hypothetical protein n=1 Tax=Actinoplanes philippinensis TaxID=35752 RepID=UPI0033C7DD70
MKAERSWSATLAAVLVLITACDSDRVEIDGGTSGLAKGESWDELRQQARDLLTRHDQEMATSPSQVPANRASAEDPDATTYGLSIDAGVVDALGTRMTVTFIGSRGSATTSCGTDYAAEPVESDKAVVVIVLEQPNSSSGSGICTQEGMPRTATLNLAKPLGNRAVLTIDGSRVPITRVARTQ